MSLVTAFNHIFPENADAGQIAIAFVVIESVADDELILDFEPKVISVDLALARFLFTQKNANFDAAGFGGLKFFANSRESVPAVEDVVENQNMAILHVGEGNLFEDDFATGLRRPVITGDAETIEPQWKLNSSHQISHENQAAIQDCDHGQFLPRVILRDLRGDLIKAAQNCRLVKQNALEIALHWGTLGHFAAKRSTRDCH